MKRLQSTDPQSQRDMCEAVGSSSTLSRVALKARQDVVTRADSWAGQSGLLPDARLQWAALQASQELKTHSVTGKTHVLNSEAWHQVSLPLHQRKKHREEEGKIQVRRDEPALTGILNFKSADNLSTHWTGGSQPWLHNGITWYAFETLFGQSLSNQNLKRWDPSISNFKKSSYD